MPGRWQIGEAEIERLLRQGALEQVPPNEEHAVRMIADTGEYLQDADDAIAKGRLTPAYSQLWEATRRALTALLWTQGLRPTTRGGHLAVQRAAQAQLGQGALADVMRHLGRVRAKRNDLDYPEPATHVSADEVDFARDVTARVLDAAGRLVTELPAWQ